MRVTNDFDARIAARVEEISERVRTNKITYIGLVEMARAAGVPETMPMSPLEDVIMQIALREQPPAVPADGGWHRGDWMQTFTGRQFYPLSPRSEDIDPLDIAHSLGMQCRYNGHVDRFYSVAEHCVLMSLAVPEEFALWALLHDATETYTGDMIRPLKLSMPGYSAIEDRVMVAVGERFGLPVEVQPAGWLLDERWGITAPKVIMPTIVKEADTRILLTERAALMGAKEPAAWAQDGLEPLPVNVEGWAPQDAEVMYLNRLQELGALG